MKNVISGKEKSPLNLIIDHNSDQCIKYGFLNSLCKSERTIVLFCYQECSTSYQKKLGSSHRLLFIDEFADPLSWIGESRKSISDDAIVNEVVSRVAKITDLSTSAIFLDDVILFGRAKGFINSKGEWNNQIIKILLRISNELPLFVYLKPASLPLGFVSSLNYHATFYAKFMPSQPLLGRSSRCEYVLRKKSGKVNAEILDYHVDNDGRLILSKTDKDIGEDSIEEEPDPSSNLTFNLRLTQSERDAKASTVLPYILKDENKKSMLREDVNKCGVGGEIIYTPDDLDDFDDEDPDDDLDI